MTYHNELFKTVKQTAEIYDIFSESGLRYLIAHKHKNGFSTCIRKLGRKIVIDLDELDKWIDEHKVNKEEEDIF